MKKNLLAVAVAASAAGMASVAMAQMYINTEHTGEALVFPFYSAQNGNTTNIHIVNTTSQFKAVKVKMVEGYESLETRDFNLYLSPQDHFSFAIMADGDGAMLKTSDNSCTVPQIDPENGVSFTDQLWAETIGEEQEREQVGYVEVIEMGQIDPDTATADAIEHVNGVPGNCDLLVEHWSKIEDDIGPWWAESQASTEGGNTSVGYTHFEETWNGGGLYGVGTVINVAEGTAFGFDAVAIEDLVSPGSAGHILHYRPQDLRPNFADPAIDRDATIAIEGSDVEFRAQLGQNHEAVSALFMTETISNDYVIDPSVNALTDWVVTMPTKRNHKGVLFSEPFSNFTIDALDGDEKATGLCQPVSMTGYDREEDTQDAPPPPPEGSEGPAFSPSVTPDPIDPESVPDYAICAESTIIHFGSASATNTSGVGEAGKENLSNAGVFVDGWTEGWAVLGLTEAGLINGLDNDRELTGSNGTVLSGLPATGFAVVEYTNGSLAGGALANYQMSWEHKTAITSSSSN
jgi:hypothetical protein